MNGFLRLIIIIFKVKKNVVIKLQTLSLRSFLKNSESWEALPQFL